MKGTMSFGDHHTLVFLAPDESKEGGWQLLVEGTPDEAAATTGRSWPFSIDEDSLCHSINRYLYSIVPSSVVDGNWSKAKKWIRDFYRGYMAVGPMQSPSD